MCANCGCARAENSGGSLLGIRHLSDGAHVNSWNTILYVLNKNGTESFYWLQRSSGQWLPLQENVAGGLESRDSETHIGFGGSSGVSMQFRFKNMEICDYGVPPEAKMHEACQAPGHSLTAASGVISDRNALADPDTYTYLPSQHCKWKVDVDGAASLSITIKRFDLEEDRDFLSIFNGEGTRVFNESVSGFATSFCIDGGRAEFVFESDATGEFSGFELEYTANMEASCHNTCALNSYFESFDFLNSKDREQIYQSVHADSLTTSEIFLRIPPDASMEAMVRLNCGDSVHSVCFSREVYKDNSNVDSARADSIEHQEFERPYYLCGSKHNNEGSIISCDFERYVTYNLTVSARSGTSCNNEDDSAGELLDEKTFAFRLSSLRV